jgi:hypothetical protein
VPHAWCWPSLPADDPIGSGSCSITGVFGSPRDATQQVGSQGQRTPAGHVYRRGLAKRCRELLLALPRNLHWPAFKGTQRKPWRGLGRRTSRSPWRPAPAGTRGRWSLRSPTRPSHSRPTKPEQGSDPSTRALHSWAWAASVNRPWIVSSECLPGG